jgi:parvulin-like peptidyl-prolyl isomerase
MSTFEFSFPSTNISNISLRNVVHHDFNVNDLQAEQSQLQNVIQSKQKALNNLMDNINREQNDINIIEQQENNIRNIIAQNNGKVNKYLQKLKEEKYNQIKYILDKKTQYQQNIARERSEEKTLRNEIRNAQKKMDLLKSEEGMTHAFHYLTANLQNNNGSPNLYSFKNKLFYTLENLYIVGPFSSRKGENASLILFFKSINDYKSNKKPSTQYMCFPLNINTNSSNANFITGILNGAGNKTVTAIDLKELLPQNTNQYSFQHLTPKNDLLKIDIYFYSNVIPVYYDPSLVNKSQSNSYNWITYDIQNDLNSFEPVNLSMFMNKLNIDSEEGEEESFTTLWNWEAIREPMQTVIATQNMNLSQDEQIYIQCSPAGASDETEMVHIKSKGHRNHESNNMVFMIITMIVIFVNIFVVGFGYKVIFKFLSGFFVKNVIESRYSKHSDKRRSAFEMFLFWVLDLIPHFLDIQWGEENVRTTSERLIRIYMYLIYGILFFMYLFAMHYNNVTLMHFSLFLILLFVFDIFLFFLQIRNLSQVNYEALK